MSNNILDALPVAEQVRDATAAGENTALRVGGCLVDIITKADLDLINIQNVLTAMPTDPFDAVLDDWANNTGAQLIEFESNGTVVASLSLLLATTSYSGLLSPADKAKIDAMPADPASESNAVGSFNTQTTATSADIIPYTVNNSPLPSVSLPVTLRDILQGGAYQAGVVAAATQNAIDLYGQGLEVKVLSGQTLTLLLGGTRLYKGGTLLLTELDGTPCQGFLTMEVDGLGVPLFPGTTCDFTNGGDTLTFDLSTQMAGVGYLGDFARVTNVSLRAASGRDVHVRLRIADASIMQTDVHDLEIVQTASYVRLFGKNGGIIISQVDIPIASTTKAGIITPQDLADLRAAHDNGLIGINVYQEATRVTLEGDTIGGSSPTSYINAATATAAGVLTAALFVKLNALPDAASLAASLADKADKTAAVGAIPNTTATGNSMTMQYGNVDGSYMGTATIGNADASHAGVMTAAMFNKLDGIEAGAQRNVQSDWSESDNTSPAYIANKPTIGTAAALNVPALGNASSSEVVKGNDTRLTDARPASDVSAWAKSPTPPVVTKADVGLGNCDNTSDMNKPVSTAQQLALNGKQPILAIDNYAGAASLDAVADTYHILIATINTYTITLPTMSDATKAHSIGIYFTTGTTPNVTISGANTIKYDSLWSVEAEMTHEINALWNGSAWVLTMIHIS